MKGGIEGDTAKKGRGGGMKETPGFLFFCLAVLFLVSAGCTQRENVKNTAAVYAQQCGICHGKLGQGGSAPAHIGCSICSSLDALYEKINTEMPFRNPTACVDTCARDMAKYIHDVLNGNAPER